MTVEEDFRSHIRFSSIDTCSNARETEKEQFWETFHDVRIEVSCGAILEI